MIHKCKDNDTVIHFNIIDGELKELLVKSIGDKYWIVVGYEDLQAGFKNIFKTTSKEIDLKIYEPQNWFKYNVDCKEQYISIYNIKQNER